MNRMAFRQNSGTKYFIGARATANQSSCFTSIDIWMLNQVPVTWSIYGSVVTAGYTGSMTTCLDYVTDEFNVNGLYVIFGFNDADHGTNGDFEIK